MPEDRVLKILRESESKKKVAKSGVGHEEPNNLPEGLESTFAFNIDALLVSDLGGFLLAGWIDDRQSPLEKLRIVGRNLSKELDRQYVGRTRRPDLTLQTDSAAPHLFGMWALAVFDPDLAQLDLCSVELSLSDGTVKSTEVLVKRCSAGEFKEQVARLLAGLSVLNGRLPDNASYIEQFLRAPAAANPVVPRHNIELINIADDGAIFIAGWIDDTVDELARIHVTGSNWRVTFEGEGLARTCREDVQAALGTARRHTFGFWGFSSSGAAGHGAGSCAVELVMKNGGKTRAEVSARTLTAVELRNVVLLYLASS